MDYLHDHFAEDVSIQDMANLVCRSRFHFCRAFRGATGSTPHQALMNIRMRRARELLADRNMSVTDVAMSVGYQTPSAFALAFRNAVGESPTAYRSQL